MMLKVIRNVNYMTCQYLEKIDKRIGVLFMFVLLLVTYLDTGSCCTALCGFLYSEKGKQPAALSWPDKEVRPIRKRISQSKCCVRICSSKISKNSIVKHCVLFLIGVVVSFSLPLSSISLPVCLLSAALCHSPEVHHPCGHSWHSYVGQRGDGKTGLSAQGGV